MIKLTIELIPSTCWFTNVRSVLTKTQWDDIKKIIFRKANYVCEICGGKGNKHPVECHEIWKFDDKKLIQKLVGLISLCPSCHEVKHIGLAQINNRFEIALSHFSKINKLNKQQSMTYINEAFDLWNKRSSKDWKLDISYLKKLGVNINESKSKVKIAPKN
jgi:hypothetical protein